MDDIINTYKEFYEKTKNDVYLKYIEYINTGDINILKALTPDEQSQYIFRLPDEELQKKLAYELRFSLIETENIGALRLIFKNVTYNDFSDSTFMNKVDKIDPKNLEMALDNDIPIFMIKYILGKIDVLHLSVFRYMSNDLKKIIIDDDDYSSKLSKGVKDYFCEKHYYFSDLDFELEIIKKIYEKNSDLFLNLSFNDKLKFIEGLTDFDAKKYFFEQFEIEKNFDVLVNTNSYHNLLKCIPQDRLFKYICEKNCRNVIDYLDAEYQYQAYKTSFDIKLETFPFKVHSDTIRRLFREDPKNFTPDFLVYLRDDEYNQYLREYLLNIEYITSVRNFNFLSKNSFISLFNDDELNILKSKIIAPTSLDDFNFLLRNFESAERKDIYSCFFKNAIEFIKNNKIPNEFKTRIDLFLIRDYVPEELFEFFIRIADKSYLLEQALKNQEKLQFLISILEKYPKLFDEVEDAKYTLYNLGNEESRRIIFPYLSLKYRALFYINGLNENDIFKYFVKDVKESPNLLSELSQINIFSDEEKKDILDGMSMSKFILLNNIYDNIELYTQVINERVNDLVKLINSEEFNSGYGSITYTFSHGLFEKFNLLSRENKELVLNNISQQTFFIYNEHIKKAFTEDEYLKILGRILNVENIELYISAGYLSSLNEHDLSNYCNFSSTYLLINSLFLFNSEYIKNEIILRIKKDFNELLNNEIIFLVDRFLLYLNEDEKQYIENNIDNRLKNTKYYDMYKEKLKDGSYSSKLNFIYGVDNGLLVDDKLEHFSNLYNKDKFLLNNLDFRLFRNDIYSLGENFVNKVTRYPSIVKTLVKLFDKPNFGEALIKISKYFEKNNDILDVYMEEMWNVIFYFSKNEIDLSNYELNEELIIQLVYFIEEKSSIAMQNILNENSKNDLIEEDYFSLSFDSNFIKNRSEMLDKLLIDCTDINSAKKIFFARYFWLDKTIIDNFMYTYATYYDDVSKYTSNNLPYIYINLIYQINSIDDINVLKSLYNNFNYEFSFSDFTYIKSIMHEAYNISIENDMGKEEGIIEQKKFIIDGNEVVKDVKILPNDGIFVNSTCAYGNMELINDDYFYSWQFNPKTSNNGICCCYIDNHFQGCTPVMNKGVLFGFRSINRDSVAMYAPYDIISINDGFSLMSVRKQLYMRLKNISEYTRHTHNEFVLFRRNDSLNEYPCVMPDCVVIFEDMPVSIKKNSIKAVEDFKKHGINIDIVYKDRKKILEDESNKLLEDIEKYYSTIEDDIDFNILYSIINRYESNMCGSEFIRNDEILELLHTDVIRKLLLDTLIYISNIDDEEIREAKLNLFIGVMDREQYKFNLILETIGNRAHSFEIYDFIKPKINELKNQIMQKDNKTYTY